MSELASFGPYSILSAIAANAVAVSFAARYRPGPSDQLVALKIFKSEATIHPPFTDALVEEARRVARLNHVNVAPVFDLGEHEDTWYAVSEFVDGIPLLALLAAVGGGQRALATEVSAFICAEAAAGLAYTHGRRDERGQPLGLVHTGLGPHSLMLSKSGVVKVTDFGIARAVLLTGLSDRAQPHRMQFTAPELLRGDEVDHRADLFSLGAIAHLMLTGRYIYDGASGDELRERAERGYVPRVLDTDPDVPEALATVIDRALKPNPADRFEDAAKLRGEIGEWLRVHAPGFGRHRLRNYMTRLLPQSTYGLLEDRSWSSLHRKDFQPRDPSSKIFDEVTPWAGDDGTRDDVKPLLDAPRLPDLGGIDLRKLLTGAHPTVRDTSGSGIAVAVTAGATAVRSSGAQRRTMVSTPRTDVESPVAAAASTASAATAADTPAPARTDRPAGSTTGDGDPNATGSDVDESSAPATPPASSAPEAPEPADEDIDFAALASETYEDDIDDEALARAARDEVRAARRANRTSPVLAIVAVLLLAGVGYGAYTMWQQASAGATPAAASDAGVFITSRPQGAEILVDGEPTGLRTPASLTDLPATGEVSLSLALAGFEAPPAETVRIGATRRLTLELQPEPHTLSIVSEPAGATVFVEGRDVGSTPLELGPERWDPRDGVAIEVFADGHHTLRQTLSWEAGEPRSEHRLTLEAEGSGEGEDAP